MHILLRKWKRKTFLIKRDFHQLGQIEIQSPVVGCVNPDPAGDVHSAVTQLGNHDDRSRIFQSAAVCIDQTSQDFFCLLDVVAVVNAIREIVGWDVELCTDHFGHGHMTLKDVIRLGRALEPFRLSWFEDPMPWWDIDGHKAVTDAINPGVPSHGRLFDRGWTCSIAQRSGEPVSYLWFQFQGRHRSESNAFVFEPSPGTCWATNMFVHPDHRMLGAFHHHWVEIMGSTIDGDTAVALAQRFIHEHSEPVIRQTFDINADLSADPSVGCDALSGAYIIGGVTR